MNWNAFIVTAAFSLLFFCIGAYFGIGIKQVDLLLTQREVVLGDGTRATCVVVQGVRSAGVTCVPHVAVGEDDAVGEEVSP